MNLDLGMNNWSFWRLFGFSHPLLSQFLFGRWRFGFCALSLVFGFGFPHHQHHHGGEPPRNPPATVFTAAFHHDTAVGAVFKDFVGGEPTNSSSSRRWKSTEGFRTTAELERADRRVVKFRDRSWGKVLKLTLLDGAQRLTTRRTGTSGWSIRTSCACR